MGLEKSTAMRHDAPRFSENRLFQDRHVLAIPDGPPNQGYPSSLPQVSRCVGRLAATSLERLVAAPSGLLPAGDSVTCQHSPCPKGCRTFSEVAGASSAKSATLLEVRLSILTPSYNYARWLPDALASVAHQGEPDVEHVVVDDGSTDDSPEVLKEWPGSLIVREKPNAGLSDTLNVAIEEASGEWLGWLNADDFYLPHALSTIRHAIKNYPDAEMFWGDSIYVDSEGRFLRLVAQHPTNRRVLRLMGGHIAPCATFVRKAAVPKGV